MEREKIDHLQRELLQGEAIEWSGEPKPGAVFTAWDIFLIPFSLLWCGFAVFWVVGVLASGAPAPFWIFGSFFICFGLFFAFGRFIIKYLQLKNTVYAITSRRIVVLGRRSLSALELKDVPVIHKKEKRDGSGSIDFERSNMGLTTRTGFNSGYTAGWDIWGFSQGKRMLFTGIENVNDVYRLVSEKVQQAKQPQH